MVGGVATWVDPCVSSLYYADTDSDGYGDNSVLTVACAQPVGYVSNGDDCDDSDANINGLSLYGTKMLTMMAMEIVVFLLQLVVDHPVM